MPEWKKGLRFKGAISKNEVMLIPTIGWINERHYYGYPVIAIAFAWLKWRCKVEIGVKKQRNRRVGDDLMERMVDDGK